MTERPNEKDEAHTVTKEPDSCHGKNSIQGRQFRANGECKPDIYGARDEALPHGDLRWITAGDLTREIVINAPTKAGGGDQKRAAGESKLTCPR